MKQIDFITLEYIGADVINSLIHFQKGNWKTLSGAEPYMNERSLFEKFVIQASKGKIDAYGLLMEFISRDLYEEMFSLSIPNLFEDQQKNPVNPENPVNPV